MCDALAHRSLAIDAPTDQPDHRDLPFANLRDVYLLVVGVLLGVALSPAVLGNLAPDAYDRLFGAPRPLSRLHADFEADTARQIAQLEATRVTDTAVQELLTARRQDWRIQVAAHQVVLDRRAMGLIFALLAALAVVMALEALLGPQPDAHGRSVVQPACRRLISTRYALLALVVALVVARPTLLGSTSLVLVALTLALALAAGLVPLGARHAEP